MDSNEIKLDVVNENEINYLDSKRGLIADQGPIDGF
mgnify:CR=1 FL=1